MENKVRGLLIKHEIDISRWRKPKSEGQSATKDLSDLTREIIRGETYLEVVRWQLLRCTHVATVDIFTEYTGDRYKLIECDKDGNPRKKGSSLSEKILAGEDPKKAIARGMSEELGIQRDFTSISHEQKVEDGASSSYPNLSTRYTLQHFGEIGLNIGADFLIGVQTYTDTDTGKHVYFKWIKSQ